jgi:8-oxo-dGTP pyrophosphatase MutT (NUDIX family)
VIRLDDIRRALAEPPPRLVEGPDRPRAAVALVLREGSDREGPQLLFIERARHEADPWSGHMAFPGGRVDPGDPSPRAAAERETREEVGVALAGALHLGRLDDLEGRHAGRPVPLVISAHVYHAEHDGPFALNHEVETAFWVPLATLVDPRHHVEYPTPWAGYPGIRVGDPERHVVWGLTYRFLEIFLARLGSPLPDRWGASGHSSERSKPGHARTGSGG